MKLNWRIEGVQLALIAAMFVVAAVSWGQVPDRLPVHWNLQGEVDGYGGRFMGLLFLPLLTLGLYLLLLFLPRLDPGYVNYRSFAGAYNLIRVVLVVFQAGIYAVTVAAAFGRQVDVGMLVSIGVGALMVVLGNVLGKIRPNWFVGIRTPWTLSSKLSWDKTHRLAAWVFIALGPMIALVGIIRTPWYLVATVVVGGAALTWLVVYSYLVYRSDPERIAPAGTTPSSQ